MLNFPNTLRRQCVLTPGSDLAIIGWMSVFKRFKSIAVIAAVIGLTQAQLVYAQKRCSGSYAEIAHRNLESEFRAVRGEEAWKAELKAARTRLRRRGVPTQAKKLTNGELVALNGYLAADFGRLNEALRSAVLDAHDRPQIELAISALKKLPNFKGRVTRVTYGDDLNWLEKYQVNSIVTENGFTSTTQGEWPHKGTALFIITSKTGKDVSSFSEGWKYEKEVLFAPGTQFKIVSRKKDKDGMLVIKMKEL